MYVPTFTAIGSDEARALAAEVGSGWLVTNTNGGPPAATLVPLVWDADAVVTHVARANPHWRGIDDGDHGLLMVTGPQAYVSPAWYPSKAEHGRVVPTWNYEAVHLTGRLRVHHDPAWLLAAVTRLTDRNERGRPDRWRVGDAPDGFIAGQLRAIVGIELLVDGVEGKAKLSQNRAEPDRRGVIDGLRAEGDPAGVAARMEALGPRPLR